MSAELPVSVPSSSIFGDDGASIADSSSSSSAPTVIDESRILRIERDLLLAKIASLSTVDRHAHGPLPTFSIPPFPFSGVDADFPQWKQMMLIHIGIHGMTDVVLKPVPGIPVTLIISPVSAAPTSDSSSSSAPPSSPSVAIVNLSRRAFAYIAGSVSSSKFLLSMLGTIPPENAYIAWRSIADHFDKNTPSHRAEHQYAYTTIEQGGSETAAEYGVRFQTALMRMQEYGEAYSESSKVHTYLRGLAAVHSAVRQQVSMQPNMTLLSVMKMTIEFEPTLAVSRSPPAQQAFSSSSSSSSVNPLACNWCGTVHLRTPGQRCSNPAQLCSSCSRPGHPKAKCFKIIGYPIGHHSITRRPATAAAVAVVTPPVPAQGLSATAVRVPPVVSPVYVPRTRINMDDDTEHVFVIVASQGGRNGRRRRAKARAKAGIIDPPLSFTPTTIMLLFDTAATSHAFTSSVPLQHSFTDTKTAIRVGNNSVINNPTRGSLGLVTLAGSSIRLSSVLSHSTMVYNLISASALHDEHGTTFESSGRDILIRNRDGSPMFKAIRVGSLFRIETTTAEVKHRPSVTNRSARPSQVECAMMMEDHEVIDVTSPEPETRSLQANVGYDPPQLIPSLTPASAAFVTAHQISSNQRLDSLLISQQIDQSTEAQRMARLLSTGPAGMTHASAAAASSSSSSSRPLERYDLRNAEYRVSNQIVPATPTKDVRVSDSSSSAVITASSSSGPIGYNPLTATVGGPVPLYPPFQPSSIFSPYINDNSGVRTFPTGDASSSGLTSGVAARVKAEARDTLLAEAMSAAASSSSSSRPLDAFSSRNYPLIQLPVAAVDASEPVYYIIDHGENPDQTDHAMRAGDITSKQARLRVNATIQIHRDTEIAYNKFVEEERESARRNRVAQSQMAASATSSASSIVAPFVAPRANLAAILNVQLENGLFMVKCEQDRYERIKQARGVFPMVVKGVPRNIPPINAAGAIVIGMHQCVARGRRVDDVEMPCANEVLIGEHCESHRPVIAGLILVKINGGYALRTTMEFNAPEEVRNGMSIVGHITGDSFITHTNEAGGEIFQPPVTQALIDCKYTFPVGRANGVRYYINASRDNTSIIKFITHSVTPNCYFHRYIQSNRPHMELLTLHQLPIGIELTANLNDANFRAFESDPIDVTDMVDAPGEIKSSSSLQHGFEEDDSVGSATPPPPFAFHGAGRRLKYTSSVPASGVMSESQAENKRRTRIDLTLHAHERQSHEMLPPMMSGGAIPMGQTQCCYPTKPPGVGQPVIPRCRRVADFGCLCPQHLSSEDGLAVRPSKLSNDDDNPGFGLFATRRHIMSKQWPYTGEIVRSQVGNKAPHGNYLLEWPIDEKNPSAVELLVQARNPHIEYKRYVNAARTDSSVTRCANDARGSDVKDHKDESERNNAMLGVDEHSRETILILTRTVEKGEEILCDYGNEFWQDQELHSKPRTLMKESIDRANQDDSAVFESQLPSSSAAAASSSSSSSMAYHSSSSSSSGGKQRPVIDPRINTSSEKPDRYKYFIPNQIRRADRDAQRNLGASFDDAAAVETKPIAKIESSTLASSTLASAVVATAATAATSSSMTLRSSSSSKDIASTATKRQREEDDKEEVGGEKSAKAARVEEETEKSQQ